MTVVIGQNAKVREVIPMTVVHREKTVSRPVVRRRRGLIPDHSGISSKSQIGDQHSCAVSVREETRIYGENACQAMFRKHIRSALCTWFIQSVHHSRFTDALKWRSSEPQSLSCGGWEELRRSIQSEHHGGVCFLIKTRRCGVQTYLETAGRQDCGAGAGKRR